MSFINNTKSLIKLAYPILIAQLIQTLMNFFDMIMAGRVSATDMAAIAIGSSVWLPIILTVSGLAMALSVIVSQYFGANKINKIVNATYQSALLAIIIGVTLIALFYLFIPLISPHITIEATLANLMFEYLYYIVWGAPAFFLFLVLRNYAEGLSFTKPTMFISIFGLLINIPLNYIFIYGELGMPALGGAGCGVATAIVYWVMFVAMLAYIFYSPKLKIIPFLKVRYHFDFTEIKHILAVGIPIALSLLFEVSLFSVIALILAPFGAIIVASHQIAINFSGLVFMIPLSIAMAVTIKVSFAVGQQDFAKARKICQHSLVFALMIAILTSSLTLLLRHYIAGIYTTDIEVINIAASLLFLAALFQFSDAIQVISAGALRGYKDTKSILVITFIAYWIIGLGLGVYLGLTDGLTERMGAAGFWIGIIIGLTLAAILLSLRLRTIQKRHTQISQTSTVI